MIIHKHENCRDCIVNEEQLKGLKQLLEEANKCIEALTEELKDSLPDID